MKIPSRAVKSTIIDVLKTIHDPEISVNIYDLGLIYKLEVDEEGVVDVNMTLTSPFCPVAEELPLEVESRIRGVAGVTRIEMQMVWEPPWSVEKMNEATRLELNL